MYYLIILSAIANMSVLNFCLPSYTAASPFSRSYSRPTSNCSTLSSGSPLIPESVIREICPVSILILNAFPSESGEILYCSLLSGLSNLLHAVKKNVNTNKKL